MASNHIHSGLKLFYSPSYIAARCGFDTIRKPSWIAESLQRRPIPGVALAEPVALTADDLRQVHDPAYVDALQRGEPSSLAESSGLEWDAGMWTSLTASNGGVVAAALHALTQRRNAGSLSAGIHHARRHAGAAYCGVNGLALAARAALNAGASRVLVVDLDAHCGGGTVSIVRDWPEVHHLDIATNPFDRYDPAGVDSTLDIVSAADAYLPSLRRRLAALDREPFDLVLFGAGVDCHERSGGLTGITFALLAEREATVFSWAAERRLPVAFCLLGGYLGADLGEEALSRLHRLAIAAAALANRRERLDPNGVMELAATQDGAEGFSFDATGRKEDAAFHDALLGDEEDDPYAYDLDAFMNLSPAAQHRFLRDRLDHPGRQAEFIRELLDEDRSSGT